MRTDTLYITDLDGTLLNGKGEIPPAASAVLNGLIEEGAWISAATARGPMGIRMIHLEKVRFRVPLVLLNGVLLFDAAENRVLEAFGLEESAPVVLKCCEDYGKTPIIYHVAGGLLKVQYAGTPSRGEKIFLDSRLPLFPGDFNRVERLSPDGAVYFTMQDAREVLVPLSEKLKRLPGVAFALYADNYLEGNWYLEVFSDRAGKANGVDCLKRRLGARRVVAFGDNFNDMEMLKQADVACAVSNGVPDLRRLADVVTASNEENGVACYIRRDWETGGKPGGE